MSDNTKEAPLTEQKSELIYREGDADKILDT